MVINMIYMININTEIFLRSVKDLNKLKLLVEVNNLDRPNFSAIAREWIEEQLKSIMMEI